MAKSSPHRREEDRLLKQGYRHVAGADEAGKGAWAGPIVAAAVVLGPDFEPKNTNDSKVLTKRQRERLFVHITRHAISWAVGVIGPEVIDAKGITYANQEALRMALQRLHVRPQAILIDAVPLTFGRIPAKAIIDGDAISLSIAAASIVAKVTRDELMRGLHRLYPKYGFKSHMGYGTALHHKALRKHGLTPVHRRTFAPMNELASSAVSRKSRPLVKKRRQR